MVFSRAKTALSIAVLLLVGFGGYRLVRYFTDLTAPLVSLAGVEQGGAYAGDIACTLSGSDGYRVGSLSVWLDGGPLVENYSIGRKHFEYPFTVATKSLADGEHLLRVEVQDSSFRKNKTSRELTFFVDNVPLQTAFTVSDATYKVFQGHTLHVQFQSNKPLREAYVQALSGKYPCVSEGAGSQIYECFVPIKSDEHPSEYPFSLVITDRVGNRGQLEGKMNVVMYPFKNQVLGLNKEKMKEEELKGLPERKFEEDAARVASASPNQKFWKGAFYVPCDLKGITTEFGTLRVSQQRGKYRHDAVDISAMPKSVIWAAQDGTVVLKERYVHSGNTMALDHGCGVISFYFHLDSFGDVKVGDKIRKGKPVGTLGMTGYASGYHLHWEIRIHNIAVDPMQWTHYDF
ncbi:TPA: hypothetical protein DDZ86_04485 [Candidatus Dependentiae bacterium]|nr:MAG: Zinc metalloendopeptidase, M23 family [candidate division TM6 bacterium GW2011_GWF2_43_87]HBL98870.1 hypothetical protein [Candidatus Dependentiae bacterium]